MSEPQIFAIHRERILACVASSDPRVDPLELLEFLFRRTQEEGCCNQVFRSKAWRRRNGSAEGFCEIMTVVPAERLALGGADA